MSRKPLRSSLLGGLLALLFLLGVWVFAALHLTSAAASPLEFPFNLQSGLDADYRADPLGARIYELRLSIVQGLGAGGGDPQSVPIPDSLKEMMSQPVPSATPRPATPVPSEESTQVPTGSPTGIPTATYAPIAAPTETPPALVPSQTATTGAVAMAGPQPDCSKLSITGVWIHNGEQIRASVRNNSQTWAHLTHTVFEWPDVPSPAYLDWMDFNTRYYNDNDYSSPTTADGTWLSINKNSTRIWSADFDDEPAEGLYGGFKVILTFGYPGWGSCVIEGFTYRAQPPTLTPSLTKTPTPTKTNTPGPAPSATWTDTPVTPTEVPSETPSPTDTKTPVPPADTPTPTGT